MITIIGTSQRLLSYVFSNARTNVVETPGEWIANAGTIRHADSDDSSEASIVLTGNDPLVSVEAARWAIAEFEPTLLLSFAYGSAANNMSMEADLALATGCTKISGTPISWSAGSQAREIRTTSRAYAVARKTVENLGTDYRAGGLASTSAATSTVDLKRWLNEAFGVQAIDRDSYDIAEACTQGGVADFMFVRAILDPVRVPLAPFASRLGQRPRGLVVPRAVAHMLGNPTQARRTIRLIKNANAGRRVIGRFVPRFLTEWSGLMNANGTNGNRR